MPHNFPYENQGAQNWGRWSERAGLQSEKLRAQPAEYSGKVRNPVSKTKGVGGEQE